MLILLLSLSLNMGYWAKADSVINAAVDQKIVPGAVLCVVKGNRIVYHKAYGHRDYESVEPLSEDVLYDMASCTKVTCTTVAAMQLWEQGLLDLDAPIAKYLEEFQGQDITVTDLMTHTSGYIGDRWKSMVDYDDYLPQGTRASRAFVKFLATLAPREARNTRFAYACTNFFLLHQIIERITGERLCDYAQEHIFGPMRLHDTRHFIVGEPIDPVYRDRIAPQCRWDKVGEVNDEFARRICKGNAGNAGLFSTASDMARFCMMLLNGGRYKGHRILRKSTVERMIKVVDPRFGRALGWDVHGPKSVLKGHSLDPDAIVHGGYTGTMMTVDFKHDIAIVLLANRTHPDDRHYSKWQSKREEANTYIGKALDLNNQ